MTVDWREFIGELETLKKDFSIETAFYNFYLPNKRLYDLIQEKFGDKNIPNRVFESIVCLDTLLRESILKFQATLNIIIEEVEKIISEKNQQQESKKIHCCDSGFFTCHYLGNKFVVTYQDYPNDSVHVLVSHCPFCGYADKSPTENLRK